MGRLTRDAIIPGSPRNEPAGAGVALGVRGPALARWLFLLGATLAVCLPAAGLPDIPPLPPSGWPTTADSERYARSLLAAATAPDLDAALAAEPDLLPLVLRTLGSALMTEDATLRSALERYLSNLSRARAGRGGELRMLVAMQVVDPVRFQSDDTAFRARVLALLPRTLDTGTPVAVREASLKELVEQLSLDYETAETLAAAWELAPRRSIGRISPWQGRELELPDDVSGPIAASIFSLSSSLFTTAEARGFLSAVKRASPKRRIVVIGDSEMGGVAKDLGATFIDSRGQPFTPWPRDPFIVARSQDGLVFVNRPNLQPKREQDSNMVRALIAGLPADLDKVWKPVLTTAPVPFHNGHVLLTPTAAWISIHTVEIRTLEILGIDRVPVETFGTREGIDAYLNAVRVAAKELEALYDRPVHFVHRLTSETVAMKRLAGGAGFDLDSLLTILPGARATALVGDISLGATLAKSATQTEWAAVHEAYRFHGKASALGLSVAAAQSSPRAAALDVFLDLIASSLAARGIIVRRLPLIHIPAAMVEETNADFLLTWNNVVLETRGSAHRAEGFASLLASGDAAARAAFANAGWKLDLYPPLVNSVVLSGGYRCASNHVRP